MSMDDAVRYIGNHPETVIDWEIPGGQNGSQKRPRYTVAEALDCPEKRAKCLGVKCLPADYLQEEREMGKALGMIAGMTTCTGEGTGVLRDMRAGATSSSTSNKSTERAVDELLEAWAGKGSPSTSRWASLVRSGDIVPYTPEELVDIERTTNWWGIMNATGSFTEWHQDAGGTSTWLKVKTGQKLWVIRGPGGEVEAVLLGPGDAA